MADGEPTFPGSDSLGPRVDAFLHTLEMNEEVTLVRAPLSTIEPPRPDTDAARKEGSLLDAAPRSSRVRLESLLGEGGMGVVYLAEQESLGRKVAVKKVRAESRSPTSVTRLLQEAWVIGQLEHPNIIPVYDISASDSGEPLIVLKRIDGVEWGQLMDDAATVQKRFRAPDLLEWNLDVMARVCDAVHFAHARGFIHRDLKPENVLIGELGEVYVADWGIAVTTRDDQHIVPHARDAKEIAGTPAYMAPEMLGGDVSRIGEKTDVYLLGGILHEILSGHPPHRGKDLREMITSILMDVAPAAGQRAPGAAGHHRARARVRPGRALREPAPAAPGARGLPAAPRLRAHRQRARSSGWRSSRRAWHSSTERRSRRSASTGWCRSAASASARRWRSGPTTRPRAWACGAR
jgi:serine/threonine protein kinase